MSYAPPPIPGNEPRHTVSGECPVCSGPLHITRLQCNDCGTAIEGHFLLNRLSRLSHGQMNFLEAFIRNRGVIKDIEVDLGISYPTVKARLDEVARTLGYATSDSSLRPSQIREERRSILEALQNEAISADEAAKRLSALLEGRS
ncbi:MAG TPA: DUF2089 domain-containing protein [Thermomicrobiales bacterium]|nr:DUF2089 domain-containing protein [Thermomicrobiales bacterium]